MDSIYGGRPGSPFVIKAQFVSIKKMQEAFKKGPEYKDVWYGEYCIIDTKNKNDFDNGKIYQRGTEYGNETGDAKYVGQVVGPQSGVPGFDFAPFDEVAKYATKAFDEKGEIRTWPYNGKLYQNYEGNEDPNKPKTIDSKSFSVPNESLVKGWDENTNTFVDEIKYTWVNIAYPYGTEESNQFAVAKTLVGFKIPYPVFHATAQALDPGTQPVVEEVAWPDGKNHPFAHNLVFKIPRGAKGDSVGISTAPFSNTNTNGARVDCTTTGINNNTGKLESTTESFIVNEIVDLYSDIGEGKSNRLYALFSSSEARKKDALGVEGYKQGFQSKAFPDINTKTLNWKDLGAIKDQSGILVGRDLNGKDITITGKDGKPVESTDVIDWLNKNYTDTKTIDGKVCTYLNEKKETWVFAWDYNKEVPKTGSTAQVDGWYYVGTFNGGGTKLSVSDGNDAPSGWYFKKAKNVTYTPKKINWWE